VLIPAVNHKTRTATQRPVEGSRPLRQAGGAHPAQRAALERWIGEHAGTLKVRITPGAQGNACVGPARLAGSITSLRSYRSIAG